MKEVDIESLKYNNHLYALPLGYRPEAFNGANINGFLIRGDWLNNLNLKMPDTFDELYEVLKAFTFNDPDKNGKNDTYGLGLDKNTNFAGIFGAFGIAANFWIERDGQLKKGTTLPETKQILEILQKWYKEKIIDPDFPVNEAKQRDEKLVNSKIGVWEAGALSMDPKTIQYASLLKATPTAKVQMLIPPKGPTGKRGWPELAPARNDIKSISAKVKTPELLIKLIDWSTNDSPDGGFMLCTYGVENEHYTFDKAKNNINSIVATSEMYKQGFSNPIRFLQVTDRRWAVDEVKEAISIVEKTAIKNEFWKSVPAQFDYPDIDTLWDTYKTKIVTGSLPVSEWEEYVQKYYQQGGKVIEEQVNAEWKKSKKK